MNEKKIDDPRYCERSEAKRLLRDACNNGFKRVYCFFLFIFLFLSISAQNPPNLYKNMDQKAMNRWVDSIFDTMTTDEKIGQLFMIIADPRPSYHNRILNNIRDQKVGGILFSGGTLNDEAESINLYQKNSRIPLFISFDGEWGLAMRLDNTPRFPKNMMLGAIQDNDRLRLYGEEMGRECKELGIQINFAPVLDVNVNPDNPVIGARSFGENQQLAAEKGLAYSRGLEKMQVMAVGKHFPGHGDTADDSHNTLPKINQNRSRLDSVELYPFVQYIRAGFSGIMTGHLSIPALDNQDNLPASLSPQIITNLLTSELGFSGLKFTDALVMKGASGGTNSSVCVESLLAGNDILLSPEKPAAEFAAVKKALETGVLSMKLIEEKCRKILCYKYITGLSRYKPIVTKGLNRRINSTYSDWLIQKLNAEAITLLKNENEALPLKQLGKRKIAVVSLGADASNPFQETMALYDQFDFFQLAKGESPARLFAQLKNYDTVVCAVHSDKIKDYPELQALAAKKEVHLCFFISPYKLPQYTVISKAKSVVLAYENTPYAQKAAAEIILGGLPAKGKLPVSIAGLFNQGAGLTTQKVRLSYQHPMEVGMSENVLEKIEAIVKEGIDKQAFPGCQVLVAKDGVVVYNKSFGFFDYAGTHPVQNTDIYDLASVTKATATLPAIMELYDTGKLKLQDPLSKYIPELRNTDKAAITVQDALFHQSGLPPFLPFYMGLIDTESYTGSLYSAKRDFTYRIPYDKNMYMRADFKFFPDKVSQTPQKGIQKQVAEHFYIADDFNQTVLQQIAESKLRNNKTYLYSDLNFMLLKEAVENISGRSLDAFVEKTLFAGLGASTTTFLPLKKFNKHTIAPTEHDEFLRNQILIGYTHDEAAAVMGNVSGNAGLFSNANDLAKLLQLFLNDGEYGGERYFSQATTRTFTQTKSPNSRRGLGFDKPDKTKETGSTGEKAPASTYGHTGYTGTCFWVDPDNQLIYIFLSNRVYPSRTHTQLMGLNIRPRIQDVIYEALKQ
jgi:beta-glucosidase-like glycosyl hydrolase/CubicO group peptidase (beta-lactamase class C family)